MDLEEDEVVPSARHEDPVFKFGSVHDSRTKAVKCVPFTESRFSSHASSSDLQNGTFQ